MRPRRRACTRKACDPRDRRRGGRAAPGRPRRPGHPADLRPGPGGPVLHAGVAARHRWHGARVLDLYGGSGAVGLEALSRGAEHVLLVEPGPGHARDPGEHRGVGLPGAEVAADRAERVLAGRPAGDPLRPGRSLDPPYALADEAAARDPVTCVAGAGSRGRTGHRGAQHQGRRAQLAGRASMRCASRRYGEATLWYGRAARPGTLIGQALAAAEQQEGLTACDAQSVPVPSIPSPTATSTSSAAPPGCTTRSSSPC